MDLFDPGLPTFHDAALFQDVDELFQHFFPPTCEDFPTFFGGMLPDVPPVQAVGRNAFLSPPVTPGITMDPQTATAPNNSATRDCDHDYGRATGPELVVAGDVHPPVAIPTTSLVWTIHTTPILEIFSCHNTVVFTPPLSRNLSSQLDQDSTKEL